MPAAIPPPPPQPSVEETKKAVRFLRLCMLGAVAFFLLVASTYGPDSFFVRYGRHLAPSWAMWRVEQLDEDALRAHEGGRIAWLVGSSITREGFDEEQINAALEARGSEWRVRKFGVARGAAGVLAGLVDELPLREGDLVLQNVTAGNLHRDWVTWTALPSEYLMHTLPPGEFWYIQGWSLSDRIEQSAAVPRHFWQWHEEYMRGLTEWFEAITWWWNAPEPARPGHHLRYLTLELRKPYMKRKRHAGVEDPLYLGPGVLDFGKEQFNIRGIERMKAITDAAGVELKVVWLPPRQEYDARFMHQTERQRFYDWMEGRPELVYPPRPPEDDFYDFLHPNFRGRAILSDWLVGWLEAGQPRGEPPTLSLPVPERDKAAPTLPRSG